jgi:hypothetical protein
MEGSSFTSNFRGAVIKKIIFNVVIVAIIVVVLDAAIGKVLQYFYFKETSGLHFRTTYAMETTRADILVFGSSRANHHYVPEVFEDSLRMSFYNTGRDGNYLIYNYAVFKSILKRYKPKIIIFDINPEVLYFNKNSYERLSSLLPYYRNHPEIRSIIEQRGPYEKYKLYSSIYPYNSSLLTIAIGNLEINKNRKADREGYIPLYNHMQDTTLSFVENTSTLINTVSLNMLKAICTTCKQNQIRLYLVQSPWYVKMNQITFSKTLKSLAEDNDAIFIDFANDPLFMKYPSWFQDENHLNDEGATKFSVILARMLRRNNTQNYEIVSLKH